MATLAQLRSEPWWDREIVTVEVDWLGDELCRRTGRPRVAFGSKGNTVHVKGAHRSQEWILNSRFCTSRTSTVQSGLTALQARHIAGADFTPGEWGTQANRTLMVEQTTRLRNAMVRGQLPGVTQVIGTLNGRTVVGTRPDGSTFSSDDSHLEHWHLTLDRRRCADRSVMERILAVALGEEDDVSAEDVWSHKIASPGLGLTLTAADWLKRVETAARAATALAPVVEAIAAKVDISPAELDTIREAARLGAAQAADDIVGRVLAGLPEGTLTKDDVAAAMRQVLLTGAAPQD
jgi:hypothetical protein